MIEAIILTLIIGVGVFHFLFGLFRAVMVAAECLTEESFSYPRRVREALLALVMAPFITAVIAVMVDRKANSR